jgi:DNA repair protein RadC
MIDDFCKITGINRIKLEGFDIAEIVKDPMILKNITDLQREKIYSFKTLLQNLSVKEYTDKINCSKDIVNLMSFLKWESVEHFYILILNRGNRVIRKIKISEGGVIGTVVDEKVIAQYAIQYKASSIILCHNHPSGNITPSISDKEITEKIKNGLKLFDINTLDHVIIGGDKYYSFAEEGDL